MEVDLNIKNVVCKKKTDNQIYVNQQENIEFYEKFSNLPFRAEIISNDNSEITGIIYSASITKNGKEEILFEDEITLKTNSNKGDKFEQSKAIITVPQNNEKTIIETIGNASVTNTNIILKVAILGNKRKFKIKSQEGLFAVARIDLQRNIGQEYFQIFFGVNGKEEKKR